MTKDKDRRLAERGSAVPSDLQDSRWRADSASAGDADPGGWGGGLDQGELRGDPADQPPLTGQSGDSVRTQGLHTDRTARPARDADHAADPAQPSSQRREDMPLGWGEKGKPYPTSTGPTAEEEGDDVRRG